MKKKLEKNKKILLDGIKGYKVRNVKELFKKRKLEKIIL